MIENAIANVLSTKQPWPTWGARLYRDVNGLPVLLISEVRNWTWMRRRRACFIHLGSEAEEPTFVQVEAGSYFCPGFGIALPYGNLARIVWVLGWTIACFPALLWIGMGYGFRANGRGRAQSRPWRALETLEQTDTEALYGHNGVRAAFCWRRKRQYVLLAHFGISAPSLEIVSATFNRAEMAELNRLFLQAFVVDRQQQLARLGRGWSRPRDERPIPAPAPSPAMALPGLKELALIALMVGLPVLDAVWTMASKPAKIASTAILPPALTPDNVQNAYMAARIPIEKWKPSQIDSVRLVNPQGSKGTAVMLVGFNGAPAKFIHLAGDQTEVLAVEKELPFVVRGVAYAVRVDGQLYAIAPIHQSAGSILLHRNGQWVPPDNTVRIMRSGYERRAVN